MDLRPKWNGDHVYNREEKKKLVLTKKAQMVCENKKKCF